MLSYGETVHQIRVSKGIKLRQLAGENISVSLISQFEHDKTQISIARFDRLLTALGVSHDEFELARRGTTRSTATQLMHDYMEPAEITTLLAADMSNPEQTMARQLGKMTQSLQTHYAVELDYFVQLQHYLWHELPAERQPDLVKKPNPNFPDDLVHYLRNVDNWGMAEINLFKYALRILPTSVIDEMFRILQKKASLTTQLPGYEGALVNVYYTAITVFVARQDLSAAWQAWQLAREFCQNQEIISRAALLPFMAGWITLHAGERKKAQALFQQTLDIFNALGITSLRDRFAKIRDGQIEAYEKHIPQYWIFNAMNE